MDGTMITQMLGDVAERKSYGKCRIGENKSQGRFDVGQYLKAFRDDYLSLDWRNDCKKAVKIFKHLRHRNAHPDWLDDMPGGELTDEYVEKTLD